MFKKSLLFLLVLIAMFAGLSSISSATASKIPSNYSFDGTKTFGPVPYYANTKSQKAYIWNMAQTKRIHNLKNYPNTVWMVSKAFVKPVKGKNEVYYNLYSAYNKKIRGIAWYGYFQKSIIKLPVLFDSQQAYLNDLKTNKALKLTRMVAKLFPNSKINLDLSKSLYLSKDRNKSLLANFTNTKFISFNTFDARYQRMAPSKAINYIEQRLNKLGYDQNKRSSLSNYNIGLDIVGNAESYEKLSELKQATQYQYPMSKPGFQDMINYRSCAIVLAIPKNNAD
ncbi:D-alanyl-D-alanine carboxypeptidase [Lentilactobacillus raoultii]|uniref:D-alanyl-D-alanine carboxypeptidase n=1 Tax=Lentilactobacillus raoultii TaxID=1987503 RepID=A0ABW3PJ81_9LACO|nr:D-alanyl-D-alanine carboxypeptidase [Lentilactobacillus raoultii]